jgi:uncharacterized protein
MLLGAVVIAGLLYVVGQYVASQPQRIEKEAEANREIAVQGRGEIIAKPDVAKLTLGVQTGPQPTAKAALDLLSSRFDGVVAAVKAAGVKDDDVKTTNLSINPVYDFSGGRQTIRGFEAAESIEVKIRDLGKIGEVLAKTTIEGVNQAGGVTFEIDDPEALQRQAREKAIESARANGEQLARALGVRLGRVKNFSSSTEPPTGPPIFARAALESAGAPDVAAPPVPTGTNEIVSTVTVTFEIR